MSKFNAVLARNTNKVATPVFGFNQTVAFSHYNNFSSQLPVDNNGKIVSNDIKAQAAQCIENIKNIAESINHNLNDVVRLTVFVTDKNNFAPVIEVIKSSYKDYKPTITLLEVDALELGALVQIEAVITCGEGTIPNAPQAGDLVKTISNTNLAPMNDYSNQSVAFSHYNHISSQLPIDAKTNKIVSQDLAEQLKQALNNVKNILMNIDVPFDDIVKVNIYTTEAKNLKTIHEVYKTFFPDSAIARFINYLPALSINVVKGLMADAKIQVEVVVSHGDGTPPQLVEDRHGIVIEAANTNLAPINEYSSQTVAFSHYNNISEQFGIDAKTNKLVSSNINEQFKQCLKNLKYIVENVEHSLDDTVKLNIFVKDLKETKDFANILKETFKTLPAGRIIQTNDLILDGALVKIDAIVANAEGTPPTNKNF